MLLMSYLCDEKQTDCECLEIIVVTNYNDPRLMAESCRDTDKPSQTKKKYRWNSQWAKIFCLGLDISNVCKSAPQG